MSQMATETPREPAKKENVFTRKLGPLPMWAWVAIVSAILIGYFYLKNKQSASTSPTGTNASQIPQFVNQVYTSVTPPTAEGPEPKDHDGGEDHDGKGKKPKLLPWKDEAKKDKRVRSWEHKHPGTEYPFNTWQGEPTAAELAAWKANPDFQPAMSQSSQVPSQSVGPMVQPWPVDPHGGRPPTTQPREMLGGSLSGKKIV